LPLPDPREICEVFAINHFWLEDFKEKAEKEAHYQVFASMFAFNEKWLCAFFVRSEHFFFTLATVWKEIKSSEFSSSISPLLTEAEASNLKVVAGVMKDFDGANKEEWAKIAEY